MPGGRSIGPFGTSLQDVVLRPELLDIDTEPVREAGDEIDVADHVAGVEDRAGEGDVGLGGRPRQRHVGGGRPAREAQRGHDLKKSVPERARFPRGSEIGNGAHKEPAISCQIEKRHAFELGFSSPRAPHPFGNRGTAWQRSTADPDDVRPRNCAAVNDGAVPESEDRKEPRSRNSTR